MVSQWSAQRQRPSGPRDSRGGLRYTAIVLYLLATLNLAIADSDGPARCEAIWTGPSSVCDLSGTWAASGFGDDESSARAAAMARLRKALEAGAQASATRLNQPAASLAQRCADDAAARARFDCYEDPALAEARMCYLDLPEPDCWSQGTLTVEGVVWRTMERGRDQICRQMDDTLRGGPLSAEQQSACRARCYQNARVRCPAGELDDYVRFDDRPIFLSE